jgi:hypothetical protein
MRRYEELGSEEISDLRQDGGTLSVLLPDSVANVKAVLPSSNQPPHAPGYFEVGVSDAVLGNREAGAVYAASRDGLEGRWTRTVFFVYRHGGRVLYRDAGNGITEARIHFPARS